MSPSLIRNRRKYLGLKGFTLYEVLVAVAILALVAVLAIPQVQKASLKSKISMEKANIALIQEAKEAYASENPGTPLTDASQLVTYLPDGEMPQSPFGTEYENVTDLSKVVASGSVEVPTTDSPNNFVSLAKASATGYTPLDSGGASSGVVALAAAGVSPTPTQIVTPTPVVTVTPTPEPNQNPIVALDNPLTAFRGAAVALNASATDADNDPLSYTFTADGTSHGPLKVGTTYFSFPSLGVKPLSVLVEDGKGGSAAAMSSVEILNRLPLVTLSNSLTNTYRNNPITFTAFGADGDNDLISYQFKINDEEPLAASADSILKQGFTKLGAQTVTVTANDGFGGLASANVEVNITNRAPSLVLSANSTSVARGQSVLFTASSADPDNDLLTYTFGVEGKALSPSTSSTLTQSFTTLGPKSVWAYVSDGFGGQIEKALTVNVVNQVPSVTLVANPSTVARGAKTTLTASATDPDKDLLSYKFNIPGQVMAASVSNSAQTIVLGTTTYSVDVNDGNGGLSTASVTVLATNTPPTVSLSANPTTGVVGQDITFSASGSDANGDPLTYRFKVGSGGWTEASSNKVLTTKFTSAGNQNVIVEVNDGQGASGQSSATVAIINRPPTVSLVSNLAKVLTSKPVTFTAVGADPDGDALLYSFCVNGVWGPWSTSSTLTQTWDSAGTQKVWVAVVDPSGEKAQTFATAIVDEPTPEYVFYWNSSVKTEDTYKVLNNAANISAAKNFDVVMAAITSVGAANVESALGTGGSTGAWLDTRWVAGAATYSYSPWQRIWYSNERAVTIKQGDGRGGAWLYNQYWRTVNYRGTGYGSRQVTWYGKAAYTNNSIVAINRKTGEVTTLPSSDWSSIVAGTVKINGNPVNVGGYAGMTSKGAEQFVSTQTQTWTWETSATAEWHYANSGFWHHPVTISFTKGGDFLSGEWRKVQGRKPVKSAMRKFNLDGKGLKSWEWVGPTEGILVVNEAKDPNFQPNGTHFFGFNTWGKKWKNATEPMKALDKNNDGFLKGSELDTVWVWIDSNSDAKTQRGELTTLAEQGITSISVNNQEDGKGGEWFPKGAQGPAGAFDMVDWWSVR